MQVIIDGLATTYDQIGTGPTVVIVPGWADTIAGWKKLASQLSASYEVIVLDLPGFGGSEPPKHAWGLNDYATFVAHFLDKVDRQPFALVGHSNGGAIAIRGLSIGLLSCNKLVLVASAGVRGGTRGRNKAFGVVAKTGKVLAAPLPEKAKRNLRQKLYKAAGSDLLVAEHMQDTFKKIVGQDVRADASRLHVPTLLVYGENDDQTPVRYGELFHEVIAGSTLEVLPGAGHFVHHDRPDDVLHAIEEFL
ncbi:MAG TPA: alpha/beta hydrolase [Candidatus Saccharimonadales bacterium]|nr:alpha/beta hydrolase [Candidatus Saccharimonadales bacterium]